jgi:ADP-L-glycero-D-manno-heptose 6-epimerase
MIVVTGGAGFIGSALVWKLNELGLTDILVVDNLGHGDKWRNLAARRIADYMHRDAFPDWLAGHGGEVETIFHMGACSATTETDAEYLMRVNFAYSKALWNWGAEQGGRLIYASSGATYGDGAQGYVDDEARLHTLRPLNPYGWSKHLFDGWAVAGAARAHAPAQWVGLKFFNVYGPGEYHKGSMASVVLHAFGQIREGGRVRLFKSARPDVADGEQQRDFVYVKDCVAVMAWLLDHPEVRGLFNLGTAQARTFRDLAESTFKALGLPPRIDYVDMPESLAPRYQYFTRAEMAKLRGAGYDAPFTSLEDGVADYVRGYLAAADRYL